MMTSTADNPIPRPPAEPVRAVDLFSQSLSWQAIVAERRPVELEIGSGKGLFLQSSAAANPQTFFVGIEIAAKFAHRAAQRIAKRALPNAVVLRGDAQKFLADVVPASTVARVHVYFPDPWWRNKHKKRRVLNERTLANIVRILEPDGEFHFWTDVLDYYEHICTQTMEQTPLQGPRYVCEKQALHSMDYTTHFERRARKDGQPVYRAMFVKDRT